AQSGARASDRGACARQTAGRTRACSVRTWVPGTLPRGSVLAPRLRIPVVSGRAGNNLPGEAQAPRRVVVGRTDVDHVDMAARPPPGQRIDAVRTHAALEIPGQIEPTTQTGFDDPVAQELHVLDPPVER